MDFLDFFSDLATVGGSNGRWKSFVAILFGLLGAGAGGYLGYLLEGTTGAIGGVFVGAFFGWLMAMLLAGIFLILIPVLMLGLVIFGWRWLTGGAS